MKLLNPSTKMHMPVNWMACARSHSKASIRAGNMGERASGPKPCVKVTIAVETMHAVFHHVLQFSGSLGSSEGCGTRTSLWAPFTKWWLPTSAIISVPGKISTWSSFSSCRRSCIGSVRSLQRERGNAYIFSVFLGSHCGCLNVGCAVAACGGLGKSVKWTYRQVLVCPAQPQNWASS